MLVSNVNTPIINFLTAHSTKRVLFVIAGCLLLLESYDDTSRSFHFWCLEFLIQDVLVQIVPMLINFPVLIVLK